VPLALGPLIDGIRQQAVLGIGLATVPGFAVARGLCTTSPGLPGRSRRPHAPSPSPPVVSLRGGYATA